MALRELSHAVDQFREVINERRTRPGEPAGYHTGYRVLDGLGGAVPGVFTLVGGRPGVGKSALGENLIWNMARSSWAHNKKAQDERPQAVVYYSLEQTAQTVLERQAVRMDASLDAEAYRSGEFTDEQWSHLDEVVAKVREAPVLIDDSPQVTVREIREALREVQQRWDVRLVVLDFLQRMKEIQMAGEERFQKTGDIAENLADIGKELHVPVWALSQVKAPGGDRPPDDRPIMSDLYGSRQLEAAARMVLFVYREDYYGTRIPGYVPNGNAEFVVAKNNNGPVGIFKVKFDAARTAFFESE